MFVSNIKIITTILLAALTASGICLTGHSSIVENNDSTKTADPTDPMFPDGAEYDFGKVQRGIQAYHAFRIVNTSRVPLRIVSLRSGSGVVRSRPTQDVLQPNQEGRVEVVLETIRFVGKKTICLFLTMDNGKETRFIITAISQDAPQP